MDFILRRWQLLVLALSRSVTSERKARSGRRREIACSGSAHHGEESQPAGLGAACLAQREDFAFETAFLSDGERDLLRGDFKTGNRRRFLYSLQPLR